MRFANLLDSLSPAGRDFERLCKWLLENVPEYRSQLAQVWLWDDWPPHRGRDIGIDLVAENRKGGLWAIQAKHYDPAYAIKKADIDSFLSASSQAEFTYRLLIATTDHLGPNARSTLAIQEKPVGMLLRSQLEAMETVWPTSITSLRPAKPKRKRPRSHQRRAVKDCAQGLADVDRGQLVMACGTGKTLVGCFLAERIVAKRVLVLVPSLSLLGQTLREWASAVEFDYLAVCSDETVTRDEQDAVVASTSELGIPVTTDPERIARFLRRRGSETKVVFSTYQSSSQIAAAQGTRVPAFDLVIADEAHRCAGPEAGVFATVLDQQRIKARKRLFMTATPRYYTGRVQKEAFEADWEVASMDEEAKFGRILHRLTFAHAIEQNLLSDYQVVVVGVSDDEAYDLAERAAFVTPYGESVTDARTLARQIGLLRAMARYNLHRVVSFHSRIDSASRFASSLLKTNEWLHATRRPVGTLWSDHVSGRMSAGERDARLRRLKALTSDERGVLANARCLTEGVDVPTLDGVAFIDPRRSQVDVVQAVGRAIRKAQDKAVGTIVIPVLVTEGATPEETLAASDFESVWHVVRALRDHDETLADELDALRRELGHRGSLGQRPRKIVLNLPIRIDASFVDAFDAELVRSATRPWEFWFGLLQRFVEKTGHGRVRFKENEDGFRLGQWVVAQRHLYGQGRLSKDRAGRLEGLEGWSWDPFADAWEDGYARLASYVARVGDARIAKSHTENGYPLGQWSHLQRTHYADDQLSADRAQRLEALSGWVWNINAARWEEGFSALESFFARTGRTRVPQSHREGNYRLGQWVNVQRLFHSQGRLSRARGERLEAFPDWSWASATDKWEEHYAALLRFVERVHHARVPSKYVEDGTALRLGQWVVVQRSFRQQRRLSDERAALLEAQPGWVWNAKDADWESGYAALSRFVERVGHANVPYKHVEGGLRLGRWVVKQRYNKGRLAPGRKARLELLPDWTWGRGTVRNK
jgi:superfamily II DNA or RNA helicase